MQKLFSILTEHPVRENVVFSPHAVTRALLLAHEATAGKARKEIEDFLGGAAATGAALAELPATEDRLMASSPPWTDSQLFDYIAPTSIWVNGGVETDGRLSAALVTAHASRHATSSTLRLADAASAWLRADSAERLHPSLHVALGTGPTIVSAVDVELGGVLMTGTAVEEFRGSGGSQPARFAKGEGGRGARGFDGPFSGCTQRYRVLLSYPETTTDPYSGTFPLSRFGGAGRAEVAFGYSKESKDWPSAPAVPSCFRNDDSIRLDRFPNIVAFDVPTFRAATTIDLRDLAPSLGLLAVFRGGAGTGKTEEPIPSEGFSSILCAARLDFDVNGTFNGSTGSPRDWDWLLIDPTRDVNRVEFRAHRPFWVTVRDALSGAILYCAVIVRGEQ